MMKKLISLLCTLMCAGNLFAYDFYVDGIYYNKLGGDSVAVTYKTAFPRGCYSGSITIPETVTYSNTTYRVSTIGDYAFYDCTGLTSVTIPNSVTTIGSSAFRSCSGLTSVTIGNSVTTIGESAFRGCSGLTSVIIPNSVTTIGSSAFYNCSGLTSVIIPNSVTTIGEDAFYECSGLTSVTIPNSVTTIGEDAFSGCSSLTKTNYIGTIADWCKIKFGGSTSNPMRYSHNFYINDVEVKDLVIPEGVDTIRKYAFYNCSGLTSVTIPNSVTTIGSDVFRSCSGLTSVTLNSNAICSKAYTSSSNIGTIFGSQVQEYIIGDSVTTIGKYAFEDRSTLTSVTIGNSVTTIGSDAFYGCTKLKTIYNNSNLNITKGSTNYGRVAYYADKVYNGIPKGDFIVKNDTIVVGYIGNATDIIIPDSITQIGSSAFSGCSGLTSVTIPNSVTTIGYEAFEDCNNLRGVYVTDLPAWCNIKFTIPTNYYGTVEVGNPLVHAHNLYLNNQLVTNLVIPNSVTEIKNNAFYGCSSLSSVTIPNSVTTIGGSVFSNCSGLTKTNYIGSIVDWCKIKFGSSTSNPMRYSHNFYINDVEVKDLVIPEGVDTIGNYAFYYCSGLTSITIPNSVKKIGEWAFSNCSVLTSITIPNSVTTIGDYAFRYCSGLKTVTIPNSVKTIGKSAFEYCSSLTSITIPNSVTTIGDYAFSGCSGLTSITIPNSVTTIGDYAFSGCSGLTSITSYATTPPICGSDCFGNVNTLYVPARSVDAYKQAYGWKDFKNIQGFPNDYAMVTCSATNGTIKGGGKHIKGDTCTLTIIPDAGYQFTQWNDGNTENPRSFIVTQDTTFIAQIDTAFSGQCGDDLTWKYNNGVLVISGTGAMYDYTQGSAPWMLFFQESISSLVINNGCTSIGNFAFYGLSNKDLKTIDLPNGIEQIGQYAFANCEYLKNLYLGLSLEKIAANAFANDERLLYITCYAIEPPLLDESAFANYDVYLKVPCDVQDEYKVAKGWKKFNKENVSCIGAEEKPITTDDVTVVPTDNQATFTWPQNDQAAGYSIEITKDGVVFCTLKFNAQGQLTGIAFAPGRDGAREMASAEMSSIGWQFTVTGLTPGSKYVYTVDVINAQQQSIKQYTGEFTTTGGVPTGINGLTIDNAQGKVKKMIIDNQLFIFRGNKLYNAAGMEL